MVQKCLKAGCSAIQCKL